MNTQHTNPFTTGDIVSYSFGSISVVLKVVKATAKSITIQECARKKDSGYTDSIGHCYTEIDTDNLVGEKKTYRLRKNGKFQIGSYARAPYICKAKTKEDGKYYSFIDILA